jgi:hypothetical protein
MIIEMFLVAPRSSVRSSKSSTALCGSSAESAAAISSFATWMVRPSLQGEIYPRNGRAHRRGPAQLDRSRPRVTALRRDQIPAVFSSRSPRSSSAARNGRAKLRQHAVSPQICAAVAGPDASEMHAVNHHRHPVVPTTTASRPRASVRRSELTRAIFCSNASNKSAAEAVGRESLAPRRRRGSRCRRLHTRPYRLQPPKGRSLALRERGPH